jgi:hypothetical protein
MSPSKRIVTQLPLTTLWTDEDDLNVVREKYLDKEALRELLKHTLVEFVVADVGSKLKWITVDKCYDFWKTEVQKHVTDNPHKFYLDDFPDDYAYLASQWTSINKQPIILLEKSH